MEVLHLHDEWFELVKCGKKKYEGRRRTPLINNISIGSTIEIRNFNCHATPFRVRVVDKKDYPTFEDALNDLPLYDVLPVDGMSVERGVEIYKGFVSLETQQRDGIVMLKLDLINEVLTGGTNTEVEIHQNDHDDLRLAKIELRKVELTTHAEVRKAELQTESHKAELQQEIHKARLQVITLFLERTDPATIPPDTFMRLLSSSL